MQNQIQVLISICAANLQPFTNPNIEELPVFPHRTFYISNHHRGFSVNNLRIQIQYTITLLIQIPHIIFNIISKFEVRMISKRNNTKL